MTINNAPTAVGKELAKGLKRAASADERKTEAEMGKRPAEGRQALR